MFSRKNTETDSKVLTVLVMPHDGGSIHQWQVPRWLIWGACGLFVATLSVAGFIIWRHVDYERENARLAQLKAVNLQVARELARGRTALAQVDRLDAQLRDMLKYKTSKALIKGATSVGGPTEEDQKRMQALLEKPDEKGLERLNKQVTSLEAGATAREKSFDAIRSYVEKQRNILARTPMGWPVRGWISSPFGTRYSPFSGSETFHAGMDIANDSGAPIRATADGVVSFSGWEGGYGKLVALDHGNGLATLYGHCAQLKVAVGQKVRRGQVVALMGSTGESTGPHCHYEVRLHGTPINPQKYLRE